MLLILLAASGAAAAPALPGSAAIEFPPAQYGAASSDLLTCWYDENGHFTGSSPAQAGATEGTKTAGAASGSHSWSYTVAGHDPVACPDRLPVSSGAKQQE
jgi:hypothetical protein